MLRVSAALTLSGIPVQRADRRLPRRLRRGPVRAQPDMTQLKEVQAQSGVAGNEQGVMMVESEALELAEDDDAGGVVYGHEQMQAAIQAIHELDRGGRQAGLGMEGPPKNESLITRVAELAEAEPARGFRMKQKQRAYALQEVARIAERSREGSRSARDRPARAEGHLLQPRVEDRARQILDGEPRIDGRDTRTVRPILGPRRRAAAHAWLGLCSRGRDPGPRHRHARTGRDEQIIDALAGSTASGFMMHYNMPPYATGETGRMGPSKRREIGHGRLAKRALVGLLPTQEEFGYSIRVVSEITESNGSSSMASVCGGSLALMDSGVPIKAHVAGIAMGLIKEGNRFAVLSDILGDEDHLGDMDFKVAGTDKGVTALQMDLKIESINKGIMKVALDQAREARCRSCRS
jgi:polyribonucleotide nucleotidyltransferase